MPRLVALASLFLVVAPTLYAAQDSAPTRIPQAAIAQASILREQALKDDVAYAIIEGLTTEVGQRLAGSENDPKAREWMIAKFKALGFDKVWTEPVSYPK